MMTSGEFGNPLRKFKLVFLGEQSGKFKQYFLSSVYGNLSHTSLITHRELIGHCKRYRATGPHRAGVDVDVTPPTGGPVGHPPPNPATLTAVRREVNRDTQGHLQNTQT